MGQKNWSVVWKTVGYSRYDTEKQLHVLNQIYDVLKLYQNFFQPSLKLQSKERIGAKVIKRYDEAKTPYQRVLASEEVDSKVKTHLKKTFDELNPIELKPKMMDLQGTLSLTNREPKQRNTETAREKGDACVHLENFVRQRIDFG